MTFISFGWARKNSVNANQLFPWRTPHQAGLFGSVSWAFVNDRRPSAPFAGSTCPACGLLFCGAGVQLHSEHRTLEKSELTTPPAVLGLRQIDCLHEDRLHYRVDGVVRVKAVSHRGIIAHVAEAMFLRIVLHPGVDSQNLFGIDFVGSDD